MKLSTIIPAAALALALALASCSPKIPYYASASYIDYSEFNKQGCFLSESNSVSFDYTPLGSVSVTVLSGNVTGQRASRYVYQDLNGKTNATEEYNKWTPANVQEAIAMAVDAAKKQGGNGIINLHIQPISETVEKTVRSGYLVTGMVIKK